MTYLIILFLGVLINISSQITYYKYCKNKRLLRSEYAGFVCGLLFLAVCGSFTFFKVSPEESLPLLAAGIIIYGCLSYCYFTFINMGETARRVRLLRELYASPQGLAKDEILARYNAEEIVNVRIKRLLDNGQIALRNGKYHIGAPAMLSIAKMIVFIKLMAFGKRSEFDKQGAARSIR